jgi:ribosomal protein L11 methylase PrmA
MSWQEHLGPFLLGTYEAELHPWWEEILRWPFTQIVDIGSKFGYYSVGLARRFPDAQAVAFDIDPWARRATRQMCAFNQTPNVDVLGFCSSDWIDRKLAPKALVVSDCEGYEQELFCGSHAQALCTAVLLIELHEELSPGVTAALHARFGDTHRAFGIASSSDSPSSPDALEFLDPTEVPTATTEIRSPQDWVLFVPRFR